jgi:hypothetical protein
MGRNKSTISRELSRFYRLAHCPDYRQQAIEQLDALLEMGAKSIRRDFSANAFVKIYIK